MRRYIYHRPQAKEVIDNIEGVNLLERSKVLLQLLANRDAVRIMCAPALYGKSVVAFQYSQIAFPLGSVTWVDASDPRFLCSLDDGHVIEHLESAGRGGLVVLDDVGSLDELRMRSFVSVLDAVLSSHAEVLITTRSDALQGEIPFPTVVVDACDLQVEGTEAYSQFANNLYSPHELRARGVPAVFLDVQNGVERFLASLCEEPLTTRDSVLAVLAMVCARGKTADLVALMQDPDATALFTLERNYPHTGITARSTLFETVDLLMDQRKDLLTVHMDALVASTTAETPHDLILSLVNFLAANGDDAFARKAAEGYLEEKEILRLLPSYPSLSTKRKARRSVSAMSDGAHGVCEGITEDGEEALDDVINVRLFGNFELTRGGISLPEQGEVRQKAKIMLALLLVNHDKEVPVLWMQRALWPDSDSNQGRSSFYNLWSYLRGLFRPKDKDAPGLHRSRDTVSLKGVHIESDLFQIEEAIEAVKTCTDLREYDRVLNQILQLYSGELLPGVDNEQLDAYRSMYQNKVLDAFLDGATFLSSKGETKLAQRYAAFAFEADPTREDVCYLYMSIQKRLGQFAGAISTFMMCRRMLVDRFGIDGSRRLDALYEEILNEVS